MTDGFTWRDIGDEDAAREQHDADATIIPRTLEEVSSLIETLGPSMSPMALGSTIEMIIEGLAKLGVDDVVAEPFLQVIRNRSRSPIRDLRKLLAKKRPEPTPVAVPLGVIEAMLVCYVYVKQLGAFWDRKARTVVKVHSVREAYWHEMPDNPFSETPGEKIDPYELLIKGNAMLGAPKACDRADLFMFKPGADEFFADERGCRALNIWVKSELLSIEGNVQPFLDHVYLVLNGNEAMVRHQLDFLAHLVQRPHVKIKSTILIIGLEGCGKTVIAEMMVAILGKDNVAFIDAADLENPFNSFMDGKILVVVNELIALSKPARNKLKAYITDSKMTINRKNVATYDYDNFANFLMYSNYEDGAIIAEGDRRFGVEISKLSPRGSDYFKKLWGWYENGGKSHLLHYLQHRPLDGFERSPHRLLPRRSYRSSRIAAMPSLPTCGTPWLRARRRSYTTSSRSTTSSTGLWRNAG
jgi:hypothetical protein